MFKVFVYGTLKPGEVNYQRYCEGRIVKEEEAIAWGRLFLLPMGYPGLTVGTKRIEGYVLHFQDSHLLDQLDQLEGYHPDSPLEDNQYLRQLMPVFRPTGEPLGDALVYVMSVEKIEGYGGTELLNGSWSPVSD
ncbi:MAG: gamma-glutamylcyclotransferase [Roseofilum sp. SBFL]|uniref:gamma-glutamylcyclotransferase family protein n=1 Tax=unclassified Roseofilum TaxID=2620099 RepID=UPI001B06CE19|nr:MULTISPECIES: gamma-glutamylcyclotransferase [unclassified Roseofilum]MBP0015594.1 gamma-glutamylcyclotransferase [Roseofilum sp. SID3]MBP0022691.1 gamma-glutamylcyclotransferase [Roseofilum sp. SID2]MBP0039251.1 gamma-glutamylcyclotransferase [Roseofilum sp. SID1]MBP0042667.1 gamma-glutamylcyclotransferase [Roseofilum sp. SBFL]